MFGGGGGLNPRKMQQMMKQMGIDVDEIDAEEVIIRTSDGKELVFDNADVTRMDARGQQTYQVVGEPEEREATSDGSDETATDATDATDENATGDAGSAEIPDSDVEIVSQRTGVSEDDAREALEAVDGDLAAAVERLE